MASLTPIWNQVTQYLEDGISLIPIRDKEEEVKGKKWGKKQPFGSWEKYQHKPASKEELWYLMEKYDTTAIATVCGKISGNMEAIDIDVKWHDSIAKLLFDEIKNIYPELFERLRIHRTPSGGFHILYRVEIGFVIPGNKKLASRASTNEELAADPKQKIKCFLETRGEGGYVAAPPSLGYEVVKIAPLAVLTIAERDSLINLCCSFNEVLKEEGPKTASEDSVYYDINPFESYNLSSAAERALTDNGWKFHSRNARALYFTRPGSKSGGIHATFLFARRLYIFFTTNSEFETDRCYKPATVLGKLQYGGDMKQVKVALKRDGYGVIKKEIEKKIVKRAVMAGEELPENLSSEAKVEYVAMKEQFVKVHPYGVFWEMGEKDAIEISRERFLTVAEGLGYRLYMGMLCQIEEGFVHWREMKYFFNACKSYIQEEDGDLYIDICSSYEMFLQKSGEFMITRLRDIDQSELLRDDKYTCYKYYLNGYVKINSSEYALYDYAQMKKLIIYSDVQQRNYVAAGMGGKYAQFLNLGCNFDTSQQYVMAVIGYLAHQYKDESTPYIVVLTEECADPKSGGGSGKNVFTSMLKSTTTVGGISGTQVKFDSAFLQAWNMKDRIFAVSDVPRKFDFLFLKELSSGSGVVKKLYKDEVTMPVEQMPKFVISTNYSYEVSDGGLKRRIIPLEFTDFFTKCGGVDMHFGCMFPLGFEEEDWHGYDAIIIESIHEWLKSGCKMKARTLSDGGWIKQFDQSYPNLRTFFEINWKKWILDADIPNEVFSKMYNDYIIENGIKYKDSPQKINAALKEWSYENGYDYRSDKQMDYNGKNGRGKSFSPINAPF